MRGRVHIGVTMPSASPPIRVAQDRDGTLIYLVDLPPEALPPVRGRDIAAAWDAARDAASGAEWGDARLFRFCRPDGNVTDLALADEDARCWAGAVDGTVGIASSYGMSVCLRLLALVDLMAHAPGVRMLFQIGRTGAALHPALLHAAATAELTAEARFDETRFQSRLVALPSPDSGVPA